jgi:hypothetical protein
MTEFTEHRGCHLILRRIFVRQGVCPRAWVLAHKKLNACYPGCYLWGLQSRAKQTVSHACRPSHFHQASGPPLDDQAFLKVSDVCCCLQQPHKVSKLLRCTHLHKHTPYMHEQQQTHNCKALKFKFQNVNDLNHASHHITNHMMKRDKASYLEHMLH